MMHKEHQRRCEQIQHVVETLTARKAKAVPPLPPSPTACKSYIIREERRLRYLTRWKHEQLEQYALREDRELEEVANARRLAREKVEAQTQELEYRVEARKIACRKKAVANQHSLKAAMRYRGWLPWAERVRSAKLQEIKAIRHHQYGLAQCAWTSWASSVERSRAAKNQAIQHKIARMTASLEVALLREAFRRLRHHQCCLAHISRRIRRQTQWGMLACHWRLWINAWTNEVQRQCMLEQRATRMGERVTKSRLLRSWKVEVDKERTRKVLAQERHQIWQEVNAWLAP